MFSHIILSALAAGASAFPLLQQRASSVPVGSIISRCTQPNTVAIGLDDGPFAYTDSAIQQFNAAGMRVSFFLNGQNWGNINDYASTVKNMIAGGHQVGSHTWSHKSIPSLSKADLITEMTKVEDWLMANIGKRPTYFRPPYLDTDAASLATLAELGYHVVTCDVDSKDYANNAVDGSGAPISLANLIAGLDAGGSMVLAHDVHSATVKYFLPMMIAELQRRKVSVVPIAECLGDPQVNWYETTPRPVTALSTGTTTSPTSTQTTATTTTSPSTTTTTTPTTAAPITPITAVQTTPTTAPTTAPTTLQTTTAPTTAAPTTVAPTPVAPTTTAPPAATTTPANNQTKPGRRVLTALEKLLCKYNPRFSFCD